MTDRISRSVGKKMMSSSQDPTDLKKFKLPETLSMSDIMLPIPIKPNLRRGGWKQLSEEHDKLVKELEIYQQDRDGILRSLKPFKNTEADYIQKEVFTALLPALENALEKAKTWNALYKPACFFNGIDHIAQLLWNNNPRYPSRKEANLHIFNMPWAQKHLKKHPRPFYPKSWLWTEDHAATVIQRAYRKHIVMKDPEVQEMREFWRRIREEDHLNEEMVTNPILLKKYASLTSKIIDISSLTM